MIRSAVIATTCSLVLTFTGSLYAEQTPVAVGASAHRALLEKNCVVCHNERNKGNAGQLALDGLDVNRPVDHPEIWEKVVGKLRAGLMPPAGQPRLDPAAMNALVVYLESELDRKAAAEPDPGRTETFHRLNRAEYQSAIRDLFGLEMDVTPYLPADDASYGFDNIAGVLKISQSRLEQYLSTARRVSRVVLGTPLPAPSASEYRVKESTHQSNHVEGLPFGTRGGMLVRHDFPQDGDYELRVDLMCRLGGECDGSVGFPDEHTMQLLIDGEVVQSLTLEPRKDMHPPAERTWVVKVPIQAGPHSVGVTFVKLPSIREIDSIIERFDRPYFLNGVIGQPNHTIYQPYLDVITIVGPFDARGADGSPSRRRLMTCTPKNEEAEDGCARTILSTLVRRAYRRPVESLDLQPIMEVFKSEAKASGFDAGIEAGMTRVLVSPEFLYRVEKDPALVAAGASYRLPDIELASRLSFFLWSSIPDELLLRVAEQGRLQDPAELERQVRRMLADERSDRLVENFAGQWLLLRNLDAQRPDLPKFPNFDDSLRDAARKETELFFASVLRENRSVLELLTADYSFVNGRLAKHYGIPKIYGNRFQRVTMGEHRRGLLGHASILTVTSRPNRTSPVLRGKWILDNILGTPPPDPPANVPPLKEDGAGSQDKMPSVRDRMAAHRANVVCAGCHSMIDPPGFALENFDAVGQYRTIDESKQPVDASGTLPDGTTFDGLASFRQTLLRDPDVFATTVTKKLLIYALGRGLEPTDMPAVRRIIRDSKPGGVKLSALVSGIVKSVPFQMRRSSAATK
jgi:mono/diheme cytochrome c family protein